MTHMFWLYAAALVVDGICCGFAPADVKQNHSLLETAPSTRKLTQHEWMRSLHLTARLNRRGIAETGVVATAIDA